MQLHDPKLEQSNFEQLREIMYRISGVSLGDGKIGLVKARLNKRLRILNLSGFEEYLALLKSGGDQEELTRMVNELTTNKTNFFRESRHFDLMRETILPEFVNSGRRSLSIWSAGCSSGEEPYTLSILLNEELPRIDSLDVKILATDIDTDILNKAKRAVYREETLKDVPSDLVKKYFLKMEAGKSREFTIHQKVKQLVHLANLNLMGPWPMKGPFDMILCRNVMIYFDGPTREKLISRFVKLLRPGGYFFVGHSESLKANMQENLDYIQPAAYRK